ncbi:MAG: NAD(P)-dependent oxidoreductase [Nitrospira sp. BO4]|jgi:nucleoside-diphosphate-sugar epimerase|nr:NAD(P)-dependent oxidoreductase [Nitrospira sp. BO4]
MEFSQLTGRKIFVTGAAGFIGSHLCRTLSSRGVEVHGVSRAVQVNNEGGVQWWHGDIADMSTVRNLLGTIKPDIVFHLASHVAGSRDLQLVRPTFESNLVSTVNLLTVASEIGCERIVLTGSLEEPVIEKGETVPCSPYAAAKWASSCYASMFHALYRTPVVMARLFMVYGPGQRDVNKLIPYVTLSLLNGKSPKLSSGGRQIDWIYVEDVVEGLLAAGLAPNAEGRTIDVGSGTLVSIRAIVQELADRIDSQVELLWGALPDRPMEQTRVANIAGTYDITGWKPRIPLSIGLERTVNWYREEGGSLFKTC